MEKYDSKEEGLEWVTDYSVYPEDGYYILATEDRRNNKFQ